MAYITAYKLLRLYGEHAPDNTCERILRREKELCAKNNKTNWPKHMSLSVSGAEYAVVACEDKYDVSTFIDTLDFIDKLVAAKRVTINTVDASRVIDADESDRLRFYADVFAAAESELMEFPTVFKQTAIIERRGFDDGAIDVIDMALDSLQRMMDGANDSIGMTDLTHDMLMNPANLANMSIRMSDVVFDHWVNGTRDVCYDQFTGEVNIRMTQKTTDNFATDAYDTLFFIWCVNAYRQIRGAAPIKANIIGFNPRLRQLNVESALSAPIARSFNSRNYFNEYHFSLMTVDQQVEYAKAMIDSLHENGLTLDLSDYYDRAPYAIRAMCQRCEKRKEIMHYAYDKLVDPSTTSYAGFSCACYIADDNKTDLAPSTIVEEMTAEDLADADIQSRLIASVSNHSSGRGSMLLPKFDELVAALDIASENPDLPESIKKLLAYYCIANFPYDSYRETRIASYAARLFKRPKKDDSFHSASGKQLRLFAILSQLESKKAKRLMMCMAALFVYADTFGVCKDSDAINGYMPGKTGRGASISATRSVYIGTMSDLFAELSDIICKSSSSYATKIAQCVRDIVMMSRSQRLVNAHIISAEYAMAARIMSKSTMDDDIIESILGLPNMLPGAKTPFGVIIADIDDTTGFRPKLVDNIALRSLESC